MSSQHSSILFTLTRSIVQKDLKKYEIRQLLVITGKYYQLKDETLSTEIQKIPMFLVPFFYVIVHAQTIHCGGSCKIGIVFIEHMVFFNNLLKTSTRCLFL